jgi:hypothetical protein
VNGDFEQGHAAWIEIPGNTLITKFSGVPAFQGVWLAHFDGLQNTHPEIQQEINVPNAPVYLFYVRRISLADDVSGMDTFVILVDITELTNETLDASTDTGGQWVGRSINLSAYANRRVTIRFRLNQSSDQHTDVYLDIVGLAVPP